MYGRVLRSRFEVKFDVSRSETAEALANRENSAGPEKRWAPTIGHLTLHAGRGGGRGRKDKFFAVHEVPLSQWKHVVRGGLPVRDVSRLFLGFVSLYVRWLIITHAKSLR